MSSEFALIALDAWRREPVLRELLPPLARIARELMGLAEVLVFQDLVIDKRAISAAPMPYHQDQSYLPLDRDDGLVAWVALDDADTRRGCLRYAPGTHRLGARRPARFSDAPSRDTHLPAIEVDERTVVSVPAVAGQALFHSTLVWHGSPPNTTDLPRRAWSIYFLPPSVRWAPERAGHPYLLELAPAAGDLPVRLSVRTSPRSARSKYGANRRSRSPVAAAVSASERRRSAPDSRTPANHRGRRSRSGRERAIQSVLGGTGRSARPRKSRRGSSADRRYAKSAWPLPVIQQFADVLIDIADGRRRSASLEARWVNLFGFCLRPGFGAIKDP